MRLILSIAAVIVTSLLSSVFAADEKQPPYGLVYEANDDGNSRGLHFKCSNTTVNELECEFVSISNFKKAKAGGLNKALEDARQQFRDSQKEKLKQMDCQEFENWLASLRGLPSKLKPDQAAAFQKMSGRERHDMEKGVTSLLAFCKNPTEENLLNIAKGTHEKDSKTCSIYTSQFTQKFKWVDKDTWVSNDGPGGLCGVVTVSRLNKDSTLWVYTTKSVVNNKTPDWCKKMDESEHLYDWRGGGDRFVGCDYVDMQF